MMRIELNIRNDLRSSEAFFRMGATLFFVTAALATDKYHKSLAAS